MYIYVNIYINMELETCGSHFKKYERKEGE
jgi:hypothetical protein